jgi:hypothetical protein
MESFLMSSVNIDSSNSPNRLLSSLSLLRSEACLGFCLCVCVCVSHLIHITRKGEISHPNADIWWRQRRYLPLQHAYSAGNGVKTFVFSLYNIKKLSSQILLCHVNCVSTEKHVSMKTWYSLRRNNAREYGAARRALSFTKGFTVNSFYILSCNTCILPSYSDLINEVSI